MIKVTITTPAGTITVENDEPASVAEFLELAGVDLSGGAVHGPAGRLSTNDVISQDTELFTSKAHSNA
jgi:hypothetical protein